MELSLDRRGPDCWGENRCFLKKKEENDCSILGGKNYFEKNPSPNWVKNTAAENFHYLSVLVGRTGRSKNGCSHFKLILHQFSAIISPQTKFHQNRMKNTKVENFC